MDDRPAMLELTLTKGREKSVRRRHPWVLSGAIARGEPEGDARAEALGAWTRLRAAGGEVLGFGHYSPHSSLRVRLLDFGKDDPGEALLDARLGEAIARRSGHPLLAGTDALRLVNAEADGLPGLVVDRYADVVVVRASSAGMHVRLDRIAKQVAALTGAAHGYARADARSARREGIPALDAPLWGAPPEPVLIDECGRRYEVDVTTGQKTGFYLDQRDARGLVERLADGRRVLDVFSYTGGFAVAAARGGATHVSLVDSSEQALAAGARNVARNAPGCALETCKADAFLWLRARAVSREPRADLVVLDPPPLARNARDVTRAARAYKDMLRCGLGCSAQGAFVLVFSCSHHVGPDLFQKIVFGAALDAGRRVQILAPLGQPADHPISLDHPEGRYLHGLLLQVVD